MAQSNISLAGIMALSDWATGKRSEQQEAALAGQRAQTGYEEQATRSMQQMSEQQAQKFKMEQDQRNEQNMWKDVLTDPTSPMAAWHFADDPTTGQANNPWVAKHIPRGYVPKPTFDKDGNLSQLQLQHITTGELLPEDFHGGSDDGHAYKPATPAEAPGGGTEEGVAAQPPQSTPKNPYTLNANHIALLHQQIFGRQKPFEVPIGGSAFVEDPQHPGTYRRVAKGQTYPELGRTFGAGTKDTRYSTAIALMQQDLLPQYGDPADASGRKFDPQYDELVNLTRQKIISAIEADPNDKALLPKLVMRAHQDARKEIEKKNPHFFEDARLTPKERAIRKFQRSVGSGGKDQGAPTAGQAGAEPASAQTQEPQSLDEALVQADREEALRSEKKAEAVLARHNATVQRFWLPSRNEVMRLVRNGASRSQAVEQVMADYKSKGLHPVQQDILQKRLQEFVSPPKPAPGKVVEAPATAKPGAAKGGVVAPMRDMEPDTGIPGTISRPLQIRAGGFRRAY